MTDPESVVRRYYAVVSDLGSSPEDLLAVLHPDVLITEHPNAVNPRGTVRTRDEALAGFQAGKKLLSHQDFDVTEVLVSGRRVAVRALWRGTIARDAGHFTAGQELVAHVAAMLTITDGQVSEHETFDCYEPF